MKKSLTLIVIVTFIFTSCTTIGTQQYTYVGDVTSTENVVGESTHVDFFGLGISAKSYANEYNRAIKDAFDQAPPGTTSLKSVKIFKEENNWNKVLGYTSLVLGYGLLMSAVESDSSITFPLGMIGAGMGLTAMNTYDFIVVAEPVTE